jgi:hypothetical protein
LKFDQNAQKKIVEKSTIHEAAWYNYLSKAKENDEYRKEIDNS